MSTTNERDGRFVLEVFLWFLCTALVFVAVALISNRAFGAEVSYRNGGGVPMTPGVPTPIGIATGRIDISVHNDADSIDDVFCGYTLSTLSATPGPMSGDKYNPGEGDHICQFADHILYCMTLGSARVYWDESRMVTPTPTP